MNRTLPLVRSTVLIGALLAPLPLLADSQVPDSATQIQLSFAPVVQTAAPAVVSIYAERAVAESNNPFADDPFFSQFFRGLERASPRAQNALGSGVIVAGGLVVSNYHVVEDATEIRIVLADRREYDGQLVLADEQADLAVIALNDAPALPALDLADSDAVAVGDLVLAIGNPFGVGQTVSSGIISGLARSGRGGGTLAAGRYFIQTDAPINPGNSGGALVDMSGRLVGINTRILTRSGGSNGIGFAIPANLVAQVVAQAAAGNEIFERPWAGIEVQPVEADIAQALGLDRPEGLLLLQLDPESPFAEAGLESGDVLMSLGGNPVNAETELVFRLAVHAIGTDVGVEYLRNGRLRTATVEMVSAPSVPKITGATYIDSAGPFQGLTVTALSGNAARQLGIVAGTPGIVVLEAENRRGRFAAGDVILTVNNRVVASPDDLAAIAREGASFWRVQFIRNGRQINAFFNR